MKTNLVQLIDIVQHAQKADNEVSTPNGKWEVRMQHILIVDDEALIRQGLKKIIEQASSQFRVVGEAANGIDGLAKLAQQSFHTVITDIRMPGMDGVEFCKQMHNLYPDINVIVLSGYKEFEYVKETLKHGVVDYLLKPVENEELIELLNRINDKLHQQKHQSKELQAEQALIELFSGERSGENDGKVTPYSRLEQLYDKVDSSLVLLHISFDYHHSAYINAVNLNVLRTIKSMLNSNGIEGTLTVKYPSDQYLILLPYESDSEVLYPIAQSVKKSIHLETGATLCMTIGTPFHGITRIRSEYEAIIADSKYKIYEGPNATIRSANCRNRQPVEPISVNQYADELVAAITTKDHERLCKALEAVKCELKSVMARYEIVYKSMHHTYILVRNRIKEMEQIAKEQMGDEFDYYRTILALDFINDIIESTRVFYVQIMSGLDEKKWSLPIQQAILYIDTNFKNEITLSDISRIVHLNAVYFSQLFKQETGLNFTQYLIQRRIETAKELLLDSSNRIAEISFQIGYEDPNYFSRVFKKTTGLSPQEYRSSYGVNHDKTAN